VNYNTLNVTKNLLSMIVTYKSISKIIIVDNDSTDKSFQYLKEFTKNNKKIDLIKTNENRGYSMATISGSNTLLRIIALIIFLFLIPM